MAENTDYLDNTCVAVVDPDCENEPYCGNPLPCPIHPKSLLRPAVHVKLPNPRRPIPNKTPKGVA